MGLETCRRISAALRECKARMPRCPTRSTLMRSSAPSEAALPLAAQRLASHGVLAQGIDGPEDLGSKVSGQATKFFDCSPFPPNRDRAHAAPQRYYCSKLTPLDRHDAFSFQDHCQVG